MDPSLDCISRFFIFSQNICLKASRIKGHLEYFGCQTDLCLLCAV